MNLNRPILSFCMTCQDGNEVACKDVRAGTRLAQSFLSQIGTVQHQELELRGVRCMSQCRRPCIVTLSSCERFTYIFGDLNAAESDHIKALCDLLPLYLDAPEGFLRREDRPEPLRERILGRLPPPASASNLIISAEAICQHAQSEPECTALVNDSMCKILSMTDFSSVEQSRGRQTASRK